MYKVLIVASTEAILKSKNEFKKSALDFDFLIAAKGNDYDFGSFDEQKIQIDQEMIPLRDHDLLTKKQSQQKEKIKNELASLKHILFQNYKYLAKPSIFKKITTPRTDSNEIFYFEDVIDLTLNSKQQKIYLESKNQPIQKYDQIYFEDSYILLNQFQTFFPKQSFFKMNASSVFQLVGMTFSFRQDLGRKKFWWMSDSNYKSVYDNFYFLNIFQNKVDIWTWLPIQQLNNVSTYNYLSNRIQKKIKNQFSFLDLSVASENFLLQPVNTYLEVRLQNKKNVNLMPNFKFYNPQQISESIQMLTNQMITQLKVKKENLSTDSMTGANL